MEWGLLGLESIGSTRRSRSLGIAPAVRAFNEQAVPGLGNAWFGQQLVLALLGIELAARAREKGVTVSNIAAATAVEALAVWWTYERSKWKESQRRLPGFRKLKRRNEKNPERPTFKEAISRNFYVVNPMRSATRDPLAAFGLVEAQSRRFNSYSISPLGAKLLENACPKACSSLEDWVMGGDLPGHFNATIDEITPTRKLSKGAAEILHDKFVAENDGGGQRRKAALAWISNLNSREGHTDWNIKPDEIDEEHWKDMRAGASFTALLASAGGVETGSLLDHVEATLGQTAARSIAIGDLPKQVPEGAVISVRKLANDFLEQGHDPSPGGMAGQFCNECKTADPVQLLANLIKRDGRILRFVDGVVLQGAAFAGRPVTEALAPQTDDDDEATPDEEQEDAPPPLPEGISQRIVNLYYFAQDLPEGSNGKATA